MLNALNISTVTQLLFEACVELGSYQKSIKKDTAKYRAIVLLFSSVVNKIKLIRVPLVTSAKIFQRISSDSLRFAVKHRSLALDICVARNPFEHKISCGHND